MMVGVLFQLAHTHGAKEFPSCRDNERNPPLLTFDLAYCVGTVCGSKQHAHGESAVVRSKEVSKRIDVLMEQRARSGQAGTRDCVWAAPGDAIIAFTPTSQNRLTESSLAQASRAKNDMA